MRRLIYAGMVFVVSAYTTFLILTILLCIPIEKNYNASIDGHCLPSGTTSYGSGALNVVSDIYVVFLPLPVIWRLNMKLSKRLKLMTVFALGIMYVILNTC